MNLLKNTFYINLTERTDRREHIEKQLKDIGIKDPLRINAFKMKHGCIGCTLSHIHCIELAKLRNYEYIFVIEDDAVFTNPTVFLDNLTKFQDNPPNKWDVLLIGGNVVRPYTKIEEHYIQCFNTQTTTGYIINNHYYDTMIQNFKEGIKQLMNDPVSVQNRNLYAVDMYWKRLQQKDNWYMIIPLTVTQNPGYSDIEDRVINYNHLMLDLNKEWLYR